MAVLSPEDFKMKESLANLSMQIAQGRATLTDLQKQKEEFLILQEQEAMIRVHSILIASEGALKAAHENKQELESYESELTAFAVELIQHSERLEDEGKKFKEKQNDVLTQLDNKRKEVEEISLQSKMLHESLVKDRAILRSRGFALDKLEKRIVSDRATLTLAFEEGRKKGFI